MMTAVMSSIADVKLRALEEGGQNIIMYQLLNIKIRSSITLPFPTSPLIPFPSLIPFSALPSPTVAIRPEEHLRSPQGVWA